MHFHKDEHPQGYIRLRRGQPYLFEGNTDWVQKGRFADARGSQHYFDFNYQDRQINFNIPNNLQNSSIYAMELVNLPASVAAAVDINVDSVITSVAMDASVDSLNMELRTSKAEGSIDLLQEKPILTTYHILRK